MDRDSYILPVILIFVVVIVLVIAFAFSGNNTFQSGKISFEYPNAWSQNSVVGNFSNQSLYSAVTLTSSIQGTNGTTQTAYIIIQMQPQAQGVVNIPTTNSILMNTTNSSVSTTTVGTNNISATQLGSYGSNIAAKLTIIQYNNYYIVIEYICPPNAVNQTSEAYNMILRSLTLT